MTRFAWAALIALAGCTQTFHGNGRLASESREVLFFAGLANELAIHVELEVGPELDPEVELRCDENLLEHIHTRVWRSTLHIETDAFVNVNPSRDCVATVRTSRIVSLAGSGSGAIVARGELADITDIDVSGSGGVVVMDAIESERLSVDLSGSGDVTLVEVRSESLSISSSGSGAVSADRYEGGDIDVAISGEGLVEIASGFADTISVHSSGSGTVDTSAVQVRRADVHSSGSGPVHMNVTDEIEATLSGSGDVVVSGDPARRDETVSGSGRVVYR